MIQITEVGVVTTQDNWRGSISAVHMVESGFTTREMIQKAIADLETYYVSEDRGSEARCIDGRSTSTFVENRLGAQVPGGTPGAALAYRLAGIGQNFDVGNFNEDAHAMLVRTLQLGYTPGDHRDTHGKGIGCGAIDKMDIALAAMLDPSLILDHKRLTSMLLHETFDEDVYMQILGAGVVLEGRIEEYMQDRESSIKEIEDTIQHQVAVLEGDHRECLVVINTVPGTTFATKRFSDAFGGIQAFNYDVWRTLELADALLPDEAGKSRGL